MSNYIEYWIYSYYSFLIEVMQSYFYKIFLWGMVNCLQVKQRHRTMSQEVLELSNERSRVKKAKQDQPSLKPRYTFLNREIKRKTMGCKDKWLQDLCSEVENAHQAAKSREVYETIK